MANFIDIQTPDGAFQAYVARPAVEPAPVVVVIQEIFGINDDVKASCHELADKGYIAISPDLFWRQEPGVSLSHLTEAEWAKGFALYQGFDVDKGVEDIAATVAAARTLVGATGKVGVMGYCLGGLMTFLTAARCTVDAAASYYGGGTDQHVGEAAKVAAPMVIHIGTEDEFISPEAQAVIREGLAGNPKIEAFTYEGCAHAFARHGGTRYDAAAATLANDRTYALFAANLG
jgi:carboxymethylenebutenolidase